MLRGLRARLDSLDVRVPALLTIALLPVGLIAVIQTAQVDSVAREREEITFLALTERAATRQRQAIERAVGVAQGLVPAARRVRGDPAACQEVFAPYLGPPWDYAFAGYIDGTGILDCSATGTVFDFSDDDGYADFVENPRLTVIANPGGAVSGQSVVVVSAPVLDGAGAFDGLVSISLPHVMLESAKGDEIDLITFNAEGEILTPSQADASLTLLPQEMTLDSLVGTGRRIFDGPNAAGDDKVFALVPILSDTLYALGSWDRSATLQAGFSSVPVWTFPILMWLASLAVAYFAVHRLVIRHVRRIIDEMRAFADDRRLPRPSRRDLPTELAEIEAGLGDLAARVVRDEAEAEDRLHEQKVMMKEIHHRVKNNLQLISSIINMQMRQLRSSESKFVLGRVRDRVLGLATIHRSLYEGTDVTGIEASEVVEQIAQQLLNVGAAEGKVTLGLSLERVTLYPDQAVPLSLFVTEAVTNALKYYEPSEGGAPSTIAIALDQAPDGEVTLTVTNEVGAGEATRTVPLRDGSGLGQNLISAFAAQLGGAATSERTEGTYRVALTFRPHGFVDPGVAPAA